MKLILSRFLYTRQLALKNLSSPSHNYEGVNEQIQPPRDETWMTQHKSDCLMLQINEFYWSVVNWLL